MISKRVLANLVVFFAVSIALVAYGAVTLFGNPFRDRRTVLSLHGGRCQACGAVQFPRHRVCIECGQRDRLEEYKLARNGTLFTFTND